MTESNKTDQKVLATHLQSAPDLEPSDEEVMEATKRVFLFGKNGCGVPKSMEQRREIYRIMKSCLEKQPS